MNRTIIGVVVLVVIVLGGIIFYQTQIRMQPESDQNGNEAQDNGQIAEGYLQYSNNALGFDLIYPEGLGVSEETEDRIKFTYLGPKSMPNTEITDGYTVTVYRDPESTQYDDLEAYAKARVSTQADSPAGGEILSELDQTTVGGMNAYRFSYESALGTTITEYVYMNTRGQGYTVSYFIADPDNRGYENEVRTILASIEFTNGAPIYNTVSIALLDHRDVGVEGDGKERGCDRVVLVERSVESTTAPLTAALTELFSLETEEVGNWNNFIARTNDTLMFSSATVADGVASIYLLGELTGLAGVCDDPRAAIQIEETALQFSTVDEVVIYLNGEETDLVPDQQGM